MQINYFFQLRCDVRPCSVLGVSPRCHTYRSALGACLSKGQKGQEYCKASKYFRLYLCFTTKYWHCIKFCVLLFCYQIEKGMEIWLEIPVIKMHTTLLSKVVLSCVYPVCQHYGTSKIMLMFLH